MSSGQKQPKSLKYSDAGVDIDEGDALIGDIAPHAKRTKRAGASTDLGGFGGLFDTKAAGFHDPILVAATDGVGTKLELAKTTGLHRGVGIDLVAMCANDILAQGAMPLFFLDYFATGKLERDMAVEVIAGIADGCVEADCALIGGETASWPMILPVFALARLNAAHYCHPVSQNRAMWRLVFGHQAFIPTAFHWFAKSLKYQVPHLMRQPPLLLIKEVLAHN
jgi:hypothetical protein